MPGDSSIERARIFAVIVLYKQHPSASVTVATLARALENASLDCAVLVYENSAENGATTRRTLPSHEAFGTLPGGLSLSRGRYQPRAAGRV